MGAVHGVYLKYVGLSAISYAGYSFLDKDNVGDISAVMNLISSGNNALLLKTLCKAFLGYSALLNGAIAIMFKLRRGMGLIGKNATTGQIPMWSYILYAPFHIPTNLYTYFHTAHGSYKPINKDHSPIPGAKKEHVPVASEVLPGWWIGGRFSHRLERKWSAIVDLTVEFPELALSDTYLLVAVWDGVPPTPAQIEHAATFAAEGRKSGDVLIHCAHGRGRSTTLTVAALVKAGLYPDWQSAFMAVKPGRPVVKLNGAMRKSLTEWQETYIDGKKEK